MRKARRDETREPTRDEDEDEEKSALSESIRCPSDSVTTNYLLTGGEGYTTTA